MNFKLCSHRTYPHESSMVSNVYRVFIKSIMLSKPLDLSAFYKFYPPTHLIYFGLCGYYEGSNALTSNK